MKTGFKAAVALASLLGLMGMEPYRVVAAAGMSAPAAADPAVETRMAMRKLWEDHITYTRNYIISALADLPDGDAIAQRLLSNQGRLKKDWAADIKSYDEGHAHMLMFADTLTDGIAKQFPDKFKPGMAKRS